VQGLENFMVINVQNFSRNSYVYLLLKPCES